jgi:signal transduction histidine kinase
MGEMIGAIAHQWRQPLNSISTSIQNLKYDFLEGKLQEKKYVMDFIEHNKKTIKFMSNTIDDFRSFFRVDKKKVDFPIKQTTQSVIDMQISQLKCHNIKIEIIGEEFVYNGLQSEYQQVILNLINNAKDAIIDNNIQNPYIKIELKDNKIFVMDNAGGIPDDIVNRIFEPYFTTKDQGKGTGMGLYMSKMIIEDNMGGKLTVQNIDDKAIFCIDFDISPAGGGRIKNKV